MHMDLGVEKLMYNGDMLNYYIMYIMYNEAMKGYF